MIVFGTNCFINVLSKDEFGGIKLDSIRVLGLERRNAMWFLVLCGLSLESFTSPPHELMCSY